MRPWIIYQVEGCGPYFWPCSTRLVLHVLDTINITVYCRCLTTIRHICKILIESHFDVCLRNSFSFPAFPGHLDKSLLELSSEKFYCSKSGLEEEYSFSSESYQCSTVSEHMCWGWTILTVVDEYLRDTKIELSLHSSIVAPYLEIVRFQNLFGRTKNGSTNLQGADWVIGSPCH